MSPGPEAGGEQCEVNTFKHAENVRGEIATLRQEIEAGSVTLPDTSTWNIDPQWKSDDDTVQTIVDKIFSTQSLPIPPATVARIQDILDRNGFQIEDGDIRWEVKKGILIFFRHPRSISLSLLPPVESNEDINETLQHNYDLGTFNGAPKSPRIQSYREIEGGVDATPFRNRERDESWYKNNVHAAQMLLLLYDRAKSRLDAGTQTLIASKEAILRSLAGQTSTVPRDFRRDFEAKHPQNDVLGGNGVYNLILAFQRVLDMYPHTLATPDDILTKGDNIRIKLAIGKTVKKQEERYSKADIRYVRPVFSQQDSVQICETPQSQ